MAAATAFRVNVKAIPSSAPLVYACGYAGGVAGARRWGVEKLDSSERLLDIYNDAYAHGERVRAGLEEAPDWIVSGNSLAEVADG
jgi:hypothetical protein